MFADRPIVDDAFQCPEGKHCGVQAIQKRESRQQKPLNFKSHKNSLLKKVVFLPFSYANHLHKKSKSSYSTECRYAFRLFLLCVVICTAYRMHCFITSVEQAATSVAINAAERAAQDTFSVVLRDLWGYFAWDLAKTVTHSTYAVQPTLTELAIQGLAQLGPAF